MTKIIQTYLHFGLIGIVAFLIPVYWRQDTTLENGGYDKLSLTKCKHYYFKGTWRQHQEAF